MNKTAHTSLRLFLTLLAAALLAAGITGCGTSPGPDARAIDLAGTSWLLTHVDGEPLPSDFAPRELISLRFSGHEPSVNGFAGCNRYGGPYEQDGADLRFARLRATRMACPELEWEHRFLQALQEVTSHGLREGRLVLRSNERERLAFVPAPTP